MLVLSPSLSIHSVEQLFKSIGDHSSSKILIPDRLLNGGTPGLQAAIIQLLITWARSHIEPTLCLTPHQYRGNTLSDDVFRTAYGLNALLLAAKVVTATGNRLPKSIIEDYTSAPINSMERQEYANTLRGPGALLECLTLENGPNEFISPFYQYNYVGGMRDKSSFHKISRDLLASCNQTLSRRVPSAITQSIGDLLYELIKNTDEHARDDIEGNEIDPGLRGVLVRYADLGKQNTDSTNTFGDANLATYLSLAMLQQGPARRTAKSAREKYPFIEISVFDSGPGLAMRWAHVKNGASSLSNVTLEEELGWVGECFDLHKTTKRSRESGRGLVEAISSFVTLKAFVRLRTGRLSLVQNFITGSAAKEATFSPSHWDSTNALLPHVAGTCFTIIFPVLPGSL